MLSRSLFWLSLFFQSEALLGQGSGSGMEVQHQLLTGSPAHTPRQAKRPTDSRGAHIVPAKLHLDSVHASADPATSSTRALPALHVRNAAVRDCVLDLKRWAKIRLLTAACCGWLPNTPMTQNSAVKSAGKLRETDVAKTRRVSHLFVTSEASTFILRIFHGTQRVYPDLKPQNRHPSAHIDMSRRSPTTNTRASFTRVDIEDTDLKTTFSPTLWKLAPRTIQQTNNTQQKKKWKTFFTKPLCGCGQGKRLIGPASL